MALKVAFFLFALVVVAYAQTHLPFGFNPTQIPFGIAPTEASFGIAPSAIPRFSPRYREEEYEPAHYRFQYDINVPETADIKSQQEERDGNTVRGSYSFIQPDGLRRIVEYSDEGAGFIAIVRYEDSGVNIPAPLINSRFAGVRPQLVATAGPSLAFRTIDPGFAGPGILSPEFRSTIAPSITPSLAPRFL